MSDTFAWLIEQTGPAFGPRWWNGHPNCPRGFTQDALEAVRFARKEDAERIIGMLQRQHICHVGTDDWVFGFQGLAAVEHGFVEPARQKPPATLTTEQEALVIAAAELVTLRRNPNLIDTVSRRPTTTYAFARRLLAAFHIAATVHEPQPRKRR